MNQKELTLKLHELEEKLKELDPEKLDINDLDEKMVYYPALKMLWKFNGDKLPTDLDASYWKLRNVLDRSNDWEPVHNYLYFYVPVVKAMGLNRKDIRKVALKKGYLEDMSKYNKEELDWN